MATDTKAPSNTPPKTKDELTRAAEDLRCASNAIEHLALRLESDLGTAFEQAVDAIVKCAHNGDNREGTVLVSGLGKSGLIGAKLSATLASLGIPSHAVHPSEAAHGDLGRFRKRDLVIVLSHSGQTQEIVNLAAILRQDGLPIIALTGGTQNSPETALQRIATVTLQVGDIKEAGGDELAAPTTSTTATLALCDALALAAARRMNFTNAEFAKRHPGGSLGGMLRPVADLLRFRAGVNAPVVLDTLSISQALQQAEKTSRRPGALLLIDDTGKLSGIFTDGDLRRLVLQSTDLNTPIADVMTRAPRSLPETAMGRDAVAMVREHRTDEIPVVDAKGCPVGILDVQDLVAARLVRDDPS